MTHWGKWLGCPPERPRTDRNLLSFFACAQFFHLFLKRSVNITESSETSFSEREASEKPGAKTWLTRQTFERSLAAVRGLLKVSMLINNSTSRC
jgi:hypothetical protein